MAVWPVTLQQKFNVDSFGVTFGNTLLRSDMDVGPSKVRSRFTDAVDVYTSTIDMDYDEFGTFYDFFKTTLNNGALPFDHVEPFTNATQSFRFVDPPDIRPMGGRMFKVSFKLEKMP